MSLLDKIADANAAYEDAYADKEEDDKAITQAEKQVDQQVGVARQRVAHLRYTARWLIEKEFPTDRSQMSREQLDFVEALEAM